MDGPFNNHHNHHHHPFEQEVPTEKLVGSRLPSTKISSPKRSRRALQKRVVTIPIADADGPRAKSEGAPPSDSWAWRKYGQKPIKGSPYPRGYYRCSSSKGCPARKQVERSRVDPTMMVITYACEHNHPWPVSRAKNNASHVPRSSSIEEPAIFSSIESDDNKFAEIEMENDAPMLAEEFCWFSDVASSPTVDSVLHSPIICNGSEGDVEAMLFPMREEDESLFADLGELPECSVVFRRRFYDEEESRRCSLRPASWCGSTG